MSASLEVDLRHPVKIDGMVSGKSTSCEKVAPIRRKHGREMTCADRGAALSKQCEHRFSCEL